MQISQAVAVVLDHGPHALGHIAIGIHIEQYRAGVADKRVGPGRGNKSAEQASGGICPHPAEQQAQRQADDNNDRDRGVSRHVDDRRAQIVVAVRGMVSMVMLVVMVGMFVAMPMIAAPEQEHAGDVDDQTQNGDRNSLVETDQHRPDEAREGFIADKKRDHGEHDGAGEAGQIAKLAGAEAETRVIDVAARMSAARSSALTCVDMCKPSATSAIEPNRMPPAISAIIMKLHSAITNQVRRSLRSWPSPRKTWP